MTDAAADFHTQAYHLHRQGQIADAVPLYCRALEADPGFQVAWSNLGLALLALRQADDALSCHRRALLLDPDSADAQNNLGMTLYAQGHLAEAENAFRAALRLDPSHANATLNLGTMQQLKDRPEAAEALFRQALALGVDPARGRANLALSLLEQVRPQDAETCCREALAADPSSPQARANLSLALLMQGRLTEGWQEYEARWAVEALEQIAGARNVRERESAPQVMQIAGARNVRERESAPQVMQIAGARVPVLPQPRWTGQQLNDETVLLWAEQGFGDVLQFCRYAPMVARAGGRVVLVVPAALKRLMATLDGVAEVLSEHDGMLPPFDYHCPLLSLPHAFGTTLETIPAPAQYLSGDPRPWADVLAGMSGLKVGLVWAGKSRTEQPHAVAIDRRRSMRLADMLPLLSVPGCSFISLQLGPPAAQLRQAPGLPLLDVSERLTDWADTAGLISGLDLVIAVDTAVAHLAGALGRPVWMLNRFDSCWRWFLDRDDTPWYPSMRLFRQARRGDWTGVIQRAAAALAKEAQHPKA